MRQLLVVAVCLAAMAAGTSGDWATMRFWSRFQRPWEAFIPSSFNLTRSVALTDSNSDDVITLQEVREDATRFDLNGDGRVTRCEYVKYGVEELGGRRDILSANFDSIDRNNDNYLTTADSDLFSPFIPMLDTNKDSQLSTMELRTALRQGDLTAMKQAECQPWNLYKVAPNQLWRKKMMCQSGTGNTWMAS